MVFAIYRRYRTNGKWHLSHFADTIKAAKKCSEKIKEETIKMGYDEADSIIQRYPTDNDAPQVLDKDKAKPESLLYN